MEWVQKGSANKRGRRRFLIGALGLFLYSPVKGVVRAAETKRFSVHIEGRSVPKERQTLRVTEGDSVEMRFTSDLSLTLHLHGIDIEAVCGPGRPALIAFDANIAGRFPLQVHGESAHGVLLYVEVHPR